LREDSLREVYLRVLNIALEDILKFDVRRLDEVWIRERIVKRGTGRIGKVSKGARKKRLRMKRSTG
jgi:hypothetical protein